MFVGSQIGQEKQINNFYFLIRNHIKAEASTIIDFKCRKQYLYLHKKGSETVMFALRFLPFDLFTIFTIFNLGRDECIPLVSQGRSSHQLWPCWFLIGLLQTVFYLSSNKVGIIFK